MPVVTRSQSRINTILSYAEPEKLNPSTSSITAKTTIKISDELASFLGKEKGFKTNWMNLAKEIHKYILENDLQDKINSRKINADEKLSSLLKLKNTDNLTYLNLRQYMNRHISKNDVNPKPKKMSINTTIYISDELAEFLGKEKGSTTTWLNLTKEINKYIYKNKLEDYVNGRKINYDEKLYTLLKVKNTDNLTYFNLRRYMSQHIIEIDN